MSVKSPEDDGTQADTVEGEDVGSVTFEEAQQQTDAGVTANCGGSDPEPQIDHVVGVGVGRQQFKKLEQAGAADGGQTEKEGEARCFGALQADEEAAHDGRAGTRAPRDKGQCLAQADDLNTPEGQVAEIAVASAESFRQQQQQG